MHPKLRCIHLCCILQWLHSMQCIVHIFAQCQCVQCCVVYICVVYCNGCIQCNALFTSLHNVSNVDVEAQEVYSPPPPVIISPHTARHYWFAFSRAALGGLLNRGMLTKLTSLPSQCSAENKAQMCAQILSVKSVWAKKKSVSERELCVPR